MIKSRRSKNAFMAGLLVLFTVAAVWAETGDVLSGRELLRAIRERDGRTARPAYANRSKEPTERLVSDVNAAPAAESEPVFPGVAPRDLGKPAKPTAPVPVRTARLADDELLKMVPAESLFCVRVNNFDYTLSQTDQFLTGVSPMPMGVSMLVRMQFAKLLGSPDLKGVNMAGNFAIFATTKPGKSPGPNPSDMFIGAFIPVTDYEQFINGNPNLSQPDAEGISKNTSSEFGGMLIAQAGNYAIISPADASGNLVSIAKSISDGSQAGLADTLDAAEAGRAVKEPLWAYGNIQMASNTFGPLLFGKIEEIKTMMESIDANSLGAPPDNIQTIMNMYVGILQTLMNETQSLSLTVSPSPNACNMTVSVSAVPGTDMADMFVADASSAQENKLLGYLEDGATMNFACKMNTPFWKKVNDKSIDLLAAIAGESMSAEDIAKMKALATDGIDSLGGSVACSFSTDAKNQPPFALKYVIAVKDTNKFNKVIDESMEMWNTAGLADFYKSMGMEFSYTMNRGVATYKGVSIDAAKLVMKSTDPNSPQAQIIDAMYGDGFDYRWGMVDGLCVCAIGGDVDSAVNELIDQVKAGGPKQMAAEMKAALALLPKASRADFVGTYNYVRLLKMMTAMMSPLMQGGAGMAMPQIDIPTKSNVAFAGKVGNGRMTVDIAMPKEHLMEIMAGIQMMMQHKMQQMPFPGQPTTQPGQQDEDKEWQQRAFP